MSDLREKRAVSDVSGAVVSTTVTAKIVTSRPMRDSETPSSAAMSGSSPVGRNSLVTDDEDRARDDQQAGSSGNGAAVGAADIASTISASRGGRWRADTLVPCPPIPPTGS